MAAFSCLDHLRAVGPLKCRWTTVFREPGGPTEPEWSNRTQVVQADRPRHDMRDAVPPCKTTGRGGALEPPPTTGPADPTASGALPCAPEGDSKPHLNNLPPKRFPPGGSALGGHVRRRCDSPPRGGAQRRRSYSKAEQAKRLPQWRGSGGRCDRHDRGRPSRREHAPTHPPHRHTEPRPRTDVSSEKGLLCDFRYTICVWMAGPREPGSVESSRSLSGTIAPAVQDLTGAPSWPAPRSRGALESQ